MKRANVTIVDMKGNESRMRTFEFEDYNELNRLVNEFEDETGFRRIDVSIESVGDDELDPDAIDKIENGGWE